MVSDNAQSRRLIEDWLPINAISAPPPLTPLPGRGIIMVRKLQIG